MELKR
jgi:hypothetical protein